MAEDGEHAKDHGAEDARACGWRIAACDGDDHGEDAEDDADSEDSRGAIARPSATAKAAEPCRRALPWSP